MLRLLLEQEDTLIKFCEKDVFGTRISAYMTTYGTGYPFALFYLQEAGNNVTAAVCKIDESITVCCEKDTDFEELSEFVKAIGFHNLICAADACKHLHLESEKTGFVVEFRGLLSTAENKDIAFSNDFELPAIYAILKRANFDGLGERGQWIADVSIRVKRGTAQAAAVKDAGDYVACAMVLFDTDKAALIGAVATVPEFRGRCYAGALVTSLALAAKEKGQRVELLCAKSGILDFYQKLGFQKTGEWVLVKERDC